MFNQFSRRAARVLADSFLLSRGKRLFHENSRNVWMPLSRSDKVLTGVYIILFDYSMGKFPPKFEDQAAAYQAEIDYQKNMPGVDVEAADEGQLRKPFWNPSSFKFYSDNFVKLWSIFLELGIQPGNKILELGCGSGWMAEFFALAGYRLTATTISGHEVTIANRRVHSLKAKGWSDNLTYLAAPMESVTNQLPKNTSYDCVFIFEALHHAFDWRESIHESIKPLRSGGWLVLANEPNLIHTLKSYRVGKLTNTHEIGMSHSELVNEMKKAGYTNIRKFAPRLNDLVTDHWIAGQKP